MKRKKLFTLVALFYALFNAATMTAQPSITVNPLSFNVALACDDSVTLPLTVHNTGTGDLIFTTNGSPLDTVNVLALTYGVDYYNEYANTISSINQFFTNYTLTEVYTTDATQLQAALAGINILLLAEPETGVPATYTGFAIVLQTFVSNGGTVIMCGAGSGNPASCWFNTGLISGSYATAATGLNLNVVTPSHALVSGVSAVPVGPNSTYVLNITNGDKVSIVTYSGNDVVSYRSIGMGKVIYIGFDYTAIATDASQIIANAMQWSATGALAPWITLSSTGDTLTTGDSTVIDVTFNSTGLNSGIYTADITVNSNDTANPQITVPCTLTVSGPPEIALADTCIDFGTIPQNTSITDSVLISNNGCDTLFINTISSSNPVFVPANGALAIPPHSSIYLNVTFTPIATASYSGTLSLLNNDTDTSICLTGGGATAPEILVNPTSFNVTLSCNDSITLPLAIYNTGGLPLDVTINGAGTSSGQAEVLALTYGVDYAGEYTSTIAAINQYFTNYNLTEINTTSAAALQTALSGKQILLMAEPETGTPSVYTGFATVLQNFASNGGTIIMCGAGGAQAACLFNTGLFAGTYFGSGTGTNIAFTQTGHPLLDQVTSPVIGPNATVLMDFTNPDLNPVIEYLGHDVASFRNVGQGKVIYLGFDYFLTNANVSRLAANAMEWAASGVLPSWLQVDSVNTSIPPGDSIIVNVTFNSSGLLVGTYTGQIVINSNDPSDTLVIVPCTLTVAGTPLIVLADTCIDFGSIINNTSVTDSIAISNNGCDTLIVSSIISGSVDFSVNPTVFILAPGDTGYINVTYSPTVVGSSTSFITIFNNDHDTTICVNGTSLPAPVAMVVPSSFNVTLGCRDSVTLPMTIYNVGGSDLHFDIAGGNLTDSLEVLALTYGVDYAGEYTSTLNAINTYFNSYNLTEINTTNAATLQSALVGKNVFLMAEPESGTPSVYTGFSSVLQAFTNNGGIVIMCGAGGTQASCLFNTGLISGTYFGTGTGGTMTVVQASHPLADQVAATFMGPNATLLLDITNVDANQVVTSAGNDVVTYRNTGAGKVIYIGFDYFATNTDASRIIANAMEWAATGIVPSWIDIISVSDTITAGDSATVNVTFNSFGLAGGTYYGQIIISTNDPLNPQIAVPCTLTVTNNVCPDFIYVANNCNGTVTFTDQSLNSPTSWAWQFGDGGTSTLANPTHTYASIGTYSVTLVACNALGCDSITLSVFVPSVSGPVAASCTPVTTGYCCLMGITQVEFNTINNTSTNGSAGYENFTCTANTNVIAGQTCLLKVTTGPTYLENVRAWIDYNNDGVFNVGTEQIFASTALVNHQANVTIPLVASFNTPLRLRVGSDYSVNAAPAPCNNVQYGQFEDYTVVIIPASAPPVALFNTQIINTCTGDVQFYDISQNLPTSWQWDFGDGNTSTLQNPTHQYINAGTYQVTLIATNSFGSDTVVNAVTVNTIVAQIQFSGIMQVGQPISFTCPTPNALTWNWDFGDGFSSVLQSPVHTYAATGNYTVTLTITGAGGCTVQTDTLISIITGIDEYGSATEFFIAPNPFVDETTIHYGISHQQDISIIIYDAKGKLVYKPVNDEKKIAGKYSVSCRNLSPGIYFVQFRAENQIRNLRMVKLK